MSAGASQLSQPAGYQIWHLVAGRTDDSPERDSPEVAARQAEADKLLKELNSKNLEVQARARQLFFMRGYFDEARLTLRCADSPAHRAAAAYTLGLFGSRQATAHLVAALFDTDLAVRRMAAQALSRISDPAVAAAPLRALRTVDDLDVAMEKAGNNLGRQKLELESIDWERLSITMHAAVASAFAIAGALAVQFLVLPFWFGGLLGMTFYLLTVFLAQATERDHQS